MISIIICSKNTEALRQVAENIGVTIGVEYEIISIDNRENQHGICKAYNLGAAKSKFEYLCFLHEDVIFQTGNWGLNAIKHFTTIENAGVFGIAGSTFKSKMFSTWWQPIVGGIEPKRLNIIQHYKYENTNKQHLYVNPKGEDRSQVACLDGVFLFTSKKVWMKVKFDEDLLKGFHGYDLDFTLRVGKYLENYVVFDILLEHFSEGRVEPNWLKQNYLAHKKLHKILPVIKSKDIEKRQLHSVDKWHLENYVKFVSEFPYNRLVFGFQFFRLIMFSRLYGYDRTLVRKVAKMMFKPNRK